MKYLLVIFLSILPAMALAIGPCPAGSRVTGVSSIRPVIFVCGPIAPAKAPAKAPTKALKMKVVPPKRMTVKALRDF